MEKGGFRELYIDYFDKILSEKGIDLKNAIKVYTACDHYDIFAIYLHYKGVRFTVFEINPHQFDEVHRCVGVVEGKTNTSDHRISQELCDLQMEIGIIRGSGDFDTIRYDGDETEGGKINFSKLFNLVSDRDCRIIASSFDVRDYFCNAQLIVMNSWYATTDWSRFKGIQYIYVYQLLADYCCSPDYPITVKAHPHNEEDLTEYFPGCNIVDGSFPIQLLLFDKEIIINSVYGGNTSSIVHIKGRCKRDNSMGFSLFRLAHYMHHIVLIDKLIRKYKLNSSIIQHLTESFDDCLFVERLLSGYERIDYYNYEGNAHGVTYICENVLFSELFGDNDYFVLDYDETGWGQYLLDLEIGVFSFNIKV